MGREELPVTFKISIKDTGDIAEASQVTGEGEIPLEGVKAEVDTRKMGTKRVAVEITIPVKRKG